MKGLFVVEGDCEGVGESEAVALKEELGDDASEALGEAVALALLLGEGELEGLLDIKGDPVYIAEGLGVMEGDLDWEGETEKLGDMEGDEEWEGEVEKRGDPDVVAPLVVGTAVKEARELPLGLRLALALRVGLGLALEEREEVGHCESEGEPVPHKEGLAELV